MTRAFGRGAGLPGVKEASQPLLKGQGILTLFGKSIVAKRTNIDLGNIGACACIYLSVCLSTHPSFHPSIPRSIYRHVYIYIYIYTYTYTCIYMSICIHIHPSIYVYLYAYIHVVNIHIYVYTSIYAYVFTYKYICLDGNIETAGVCKFRSLNHHLLPRLLVRWNPHASC